jgi:hypothetical protein
VLPGRAYWLAVAPFHRFVFPDMIDGISRDAERRAIGLEPAEVRSTVESIETPAGRH